MGRNRTGPLCSVGCQTAHVPGRQRTDCSRTRLPASPHAGSVTDDRRWRQTPTDDSVQNNTGPLGGPVITVVIFKYCLTCDMYFLQSTDMLLCNCAVEAYDCWQLVAISTSTQWTNAVHQRCRSVLICINLTYILLFGHTSVVMVTGICNSVSGGTGGVFLTCHRGGGAGCSGEYRLVSRLVLLIGNRWMSRFGCPGMC